MNPWPPFVWSFSRHQTWRRCRRAYWYDYYGARGGWRTGADPRARDLFLYKGLKTVPQFVGILVHEIAERLLRMIRDGRTIDREAVLEDAARQARRAIEDALAGLYRLDPTKYHGFVDVELADDTPPEHWAMTVDDVVLQVRALLDHPVFERLLEVPDRIVEIEELERVPIARVPTWVALDVLVRDGRGGFVVIDWKTGHLFDLPTIRQQVAVYATYVARKYEVPTRVIRGLAVSTRHGKFAELGFEPSAFTGVQDLVRRSASEMLAVLPDPETDDAPEEALPMLPDDAPACVTCRYRKLCGR